MPRDQPIQHLLILSFCLGFELVVGKMSHECQLKIEDQFVPEMWTEWFYQTQAEGVSTIGYLKIST